MEIPRSPCAAEVQRVENTGELILSHDSHVKKVLLLWVTNELALKPPELH